jgi:hypothetical protein
MLLQSSMEDDLERLQSLRRRLETAAREAEAIVAEAVHLGERLRNRAQGLLLQEEHERRRREGPHLQA